MLLLLLFLLLLLLLLLFFLWFLMLFLLILLFFMYTFDVNTFYNAAKYENSYCFDELNFPKYAVQLIGKLVVGPIAIVPVVANLGNLVLRLIEKM